MIAWLRHLMGGNPGTQDRKRRTEAKITLPPSRSEVPARAGAPMDTAESVQADAELPRCPRCGCDRSDP